MSATAGEKNSLYDFKLKTSKGKELDFKELKGKPILITNIATKCGFTPQLDGLEKIHDEYKEKGLVVIGIPSNDFGSQNPEDGAGTAEFCKLNYGVSFTVTEKIHVKGSERHELFNFIASKRGALFNVMWNFEKFLFDKEGNLVDAYRSMTKPESEKIKKAIEKEL